MIFIVKGQAMKIRDGFVSNSSSSSYIIAFKKERQTCPHCGRIDPDVETMFETNLDYNEEKPVIFSCGFEEVFNDMKNWFDIGNEQYPCVPKQFARFWKICFLMDDLAAEGFKVAHISIPYRDGHTFDILKSASNARIVFDLET